jgi:hypothetical protein
MLDHHQQGYRVQGEMGAASVPEAAQGEERNSMGTASMDPVPEVLMAEIRGLVVNLGSIVPSPVRSATPPNWSCTYVIEIPVAP